MTGHFPSRTQTYDDVLSSWRHRFCSTWIGAPGKGEVLGIPVLDTSYYNILSAKSPWPGCRWYATLRPTDERRAKPPSHPHYSLSTDLRRSEPPEVDRVLEEARACRFPKRGQSYARRRPFIDPGCRTGGIATVNVARCQCKQINRRGLRRLTAIIGVAREIRFLEQSQEDPPWRECSSSRSSTPRRRFMWVIMFTSKEENREERDGARERVGRKDT